MIWLVFNVEYQLRISVAQTLILFLCQNLASWKWAQTHKMGNFCEFCKIWKIQNFSKIEEFRINSFHGIKNWKKIWVPSGHNLGDLGWNDPGIPLPVLQPNGEMVYCELFPPIGSSNKKTSVWKRSCQIALWSSSPYFRDP